MSSDNEIPQELVDPQDVDNDQSGLMFRWKNLFSDSEEKTNNEVITDWIGQAPEDWYGRTNISVNQAAPIAFLANIEQLIPNAIHGGTLESISDDVLRDYLEILTSIEGESREQQVEVLKEALSDNGDDQEINIGPENSTQTDND